MLFSLEEVAKQLQSSRFDKKIVECTGSFDILHKGHISFLSQAKSKGDILVVGVNNDASIKMRKGDGRPVMPEEERILIISSLSFVDFVFIKELCMNREEIITILRPDVVVCNNDVHRSAEHIRRHNSLKKRFPNVDFILSLEEKRNSKWSTTEIINRIKNS